MDELLSWLDSVPALKDGYSLKEEGAVSGKFSVCCKVVPMNGETLILKRSVVGDMDVRSGEKWERDIQSLGAEFEFYTRFWNSVEEGSSCFVIPRLYSSYTNYDKVRDCPKIGVEYQPRSNLVFGLLLEDLSSESQLMEGLNMNQLEIMMDQMASFHIQTTKIRKEINSMLWKLGTFWTKDKRQDYDTEVAGIEERWKQTFCNWKDELTRSIEQDEFGILRNIKMNDETNTQKLVDRILPNIGFILSKHCANISKVVESEERLCIVHGDNKVANIFFNSSNQFRWIDFQWAGAGSPNLDLVYLIAGSVKEVDKLENVIGNSTMLETLLEKYWKEFDKFDRSEEKQSVRLTNFKYCFLDYARVVLGYMWDGKLTPSKVEERTNKINFVLHNRSVIHVKWMVQKIIQYLVELKMVPL